MEKLLCQHKRKQLNCSREFILQFRSLRLKTSEWQSCSLRLAVEKSDLSDRMLVQVSLATNLHNSLSLPTTLTSLSSLGNVLVNTAIGQSGVPRVVSFNSTRSPTCRLLWGLHHFVQSGYVPCHLIQSSSIS